MNKPTPEKNVADIHIIILDSIALNMSSIEQNNSYGEIYIHDPEEEDFLCCVVHINNIYTT